MALRPETRLVSIMAANNVTGAIQPIEELGRISRRHGAVFHTDAVQAFGKIPLDVRRMPVDLVSISAHKLHGPKGVGALYVRRGVALTPILHGGGQEGGRRSSTENVAGIVGLGVAAELARAEMAAEAARLVQIRNRLIDAITATIPNAYLIGASLPPLARPYLSRPGGNGGRGHQAPAGVGHAGRCRLVRQRVQQQPRRPAVARVGSHGI